MLNRFFGAPPKRRKDSSVKTVGLAPKQLHFRLALESSEYDLDQLPLDAYYSACGSVYDRRDKAWYWSSLFGGALFLYATGVLKGFSFPSIELDAEVVGFALFALYSVTVLLYSLAQSKVYRYQSLFEAVADTSSAARRQDFLLRYPKVYSGLMYSNWLTARPRYMHPRQAFPKRLVLLLLLTIPTLIAMISFMIWLLTTVTIDLWHYDVQTLGNWGRVLVCVSWAGLFFAALMQTFSYRKIYFDHFGLSELLGRYEKRDRARYLHYIRKIDQAKERMELD